MIDQHFDRQQKPWHPFASDTVFNVFNDPMVRARWEREQAEMRAEHPDLFTDQSPAHRTKARRIARLLSNLKTSK